MRKKPKPFVICPSVIDEAKYEICNILYTDPCEDCPIPIKIAEYMTKSDQEGST